MTFTTKSPHSVVLNQFRVLRINLSERPFLLEIAAFTGKKKGCHRQLFRALQAAQVVSESGQ